MPSSSMVATGSHTSLAMQNWFEMTGIAREVAGTFSTMTDHPLAMSPHSDHALRSVSAVPLPDGATRFYFEAANKSS